MVPCKWMVEVKVKMGSVNVAVGVRGKAGLGVVSDRDGDGGQRGIWKADLAPRYPGPGEPALNA